MKNRFIPVVLTAALTSVSTLFIAAHLHKQLPFLSAAESRQLPVNYVKYDGNMPMASNGGPVNFEPAAEASVKAVVHIKTTTKPRMVTAPNIFGELFGEQELSQQIGSGSGVVISPDGYIVTNNHVVADANEVTVTFNDKYTTQAKVIGTDPATDIAVIKVNENNLPYMEFGNSDDVKLGQWVLAVGYPLNLDATVTAGIISAKGRSLGINRTQSASAIESFIQTDAAVNPGNSGGALVNTAGQLVGINSAIASLTGSYSGYSYAIPSNLVRKAANDLMKYGSVQRPYLGVIPMDARSATPEQVSALGLDRKDGVYISEVKPGSGAAKAGLEKGDFITKVNGVNVQSEPEFREQVARYQPGDNINITYNRGSKTYNTTVQLTNLRGTTAILKDQGNKLLGATFRPLTDDERQQYNVNGLMVTDVGNGLLAKQTNMHRGFVITGINNAGVSSLGDLQAALAGNDEAQIAGFYPGYRGMYYYALSKYQDALNAQ